MLNRMQAIQLNIFALIMTLSCVSNSLKYCLTVFSTVQHCMVKTGPSDHPNLIWKTKDRSKLLLADVG